MKSHWSRMRIATVVAAATLGIVVGPAAADGSEPASGQLPGDSAVPFWPHETGVVFGTAETFVDMRADGSYYDASSGHRVFIAE